MWFVALACGGLDLLDPPTDGFVHDDLVRIVSPANGTAVEPDFTVAFEAGGDVVDVALGIDGVAEATVDAGTGAVAAHASAGKHVVALRGLDASGGVLSEHAITVQVVEGEPWVAIVSPSDGSVVPNPVTFVVSASADVDSIDLLADDFPLGSIESPGVVSFDFKGVGFPRAVVAEARIDGVLVATDAIGITVTNPSTPPSSDFDEIVQALLLEYPTDGSNPYWWPSGSAWEGTTRDVYYRGVKVADGDPYGRCYCVGLTWEVYMRAFAAVDHMTGGDGTLNGLSLGDLEEFRVDWYVRELLGAGASDALDGYGIGARVEDLESAAPGDFVQLWRNDGTGHSAIWQGWLRDANGRIVGIHYWSTQDDTDGIGYREEWFGSGSHDVDPNLVFLARAAGPSDWIPWQ